MGRLRDGNIDDRHIVSAAIRVRHKSGQTGHTLIFSLPAPARHNDIIRAMVEAGIPPPIGSLYEQGFLDSEGVFAWRTRARAIAEDADQLLPRAGKTNELYSEDVW